MDGKVRIIGGRWRRRKLSIASGSGLRPTPDRVRETLFNWLEPIIAGARCLDLFAGSGALGFEAASRGAGDVVMVDNDRKITGELERQTLELGATEVAVVCEDARRWLKGPPRPFDIVMLDPPFGSDLLAEVCDQLSGSAWLAPGACLYLESNQALSDASLPAGWGMARSKRAGQVRYHLVLTP